MRMTKAMKEAQRLVQTTWEKYQASRDQHKPADIIRSLWDRHCAAVVDEQALHKTLKPAVSPRPRRMWAVVNRKTGNIVFVERSQQSARNLRNDRERVVRVNVTAD